MFICCPSFTFPYFITFLRYVMAQKSDEVRKREALSNGFATYMRLNTVMQSETSANVSPVMQTPAQV